MERKHKTGAVVTIYRPHLMSERGRKEIAAWLRKQAAALVKQGGEYAPRFDARYLYLK